MVLQRRKKKQTEGHRFKQFVNYLIQMHSKISENRGDGACNADCAFLAARHPYMKQTTVLIKLYAHYLPLNTTIEI